MAPGFIACLPARLPLPIRLLLVLPADEALVDLWLTTVGMPAKSLCKDECQPLRDNAIAEGQCNHGA